MNGYDVTIFVGDVIEIGGQKLRVPLDRLLKFRNMRQTAQQIGRLEIVLLKIIPLVPTEIA